MCGAAHRIIKVHGDGHCQKRIMMPCLARSSSWNILMVILWWTKRVLTKIMRTSGMNHSLDASNLPDSAVKCWSAQSQSLAQFQTFAHWLLTMIDRPLHVCPIVHPQLLANCFLWLHTDTGKKHIYRVRVCSLTFRENFETPGWRFTFFLCKPWAALPFARTLQTVCMPARLLSVYTCILC